ncbi:hypothetical protein [Nonomuraea recticatena]|uniref:Uncharacterized protein n=1 Tax=Nonomuraea recticatena TaxID=46178 RepID=A0ABN3T316_9ACTN
MNNTDPGMRGCAVLVQQTGRVLTIAVLAWAALTTSSLALAISAWTLAALFILRILFHSADGVLLADRPPAPHTSRQHPHTRVARR